MNRRFLSAFFAVLILLSVAFLPSAIPASASAGGLTFLGAATFNDEWGVGLHELNNPVGLQTTMTAPTGTMTIPSADTDGCTTWGSCGSYDEAEINEHIHVQGYCSWAGIRFTRFENELQHMLFQVQDGCTSGLSNQIRYSTYITGTTFRTNYVSSGVSRPVYHDTTWTGQTGAYTDNQIRVRMYRDTTNSSCVNVDLYNLVTSTWDRIDQNCTAYNYTLGARHFADSSYFWYGMYYAGTSNWNSSGDLGASGALYMSDMQTQATAGGSWASVLSVNSSNDSYLKNHYASSTFYNNPIDAGTFKYEWSAGGALSGTGSSAVSAQMALCFAAHTTFCDYTQNRAPNDKEYASYQAMPTIAGYSDFTLPYNLSIQRSSPDNSIIKGVNQKLRAARTFYIRANCYTSCSDVEVELDLGSTAN